MDDGAREPDPSQQDLPTSDRVDAEETLSPDRLRRIFVRAQMTEFVAEPFVVARAEGVHYWDVHGKKYLDALSGIYVAALGHSNTRVADAVKRQMDVLKLSTPMHGTNPMSIRLAHRLADIAPGDLNAVKLCSGGAEATETAIAIARQYHKLRGNATKYKIVSRYESWHGSTLGSLSASGLASRKTGTEPMAAGFAHVFPPTCYRCPFGKSYPVCGLTCATLIEDVIGLEGPETVAAIIGDVRGRGLFLGVEFVRDPVTKEPFNEPVGILIGKRALELGMLTRYDRHWLAIGPPLIITDDHADEIIAILDQSIRDVLAVV